VVRPSAVGGPFLISVPRSGPRRSYEGEESERPRIFIVGAGMAGLTAARRLQQLGLPSTVLDKGRRVGGRMATRTLDGARFDHGAQHFSVRTEAFAGSVDSWTEDGIAAVWFRSRSVSNPDRGREPRFMGKEGMRSIPEHVAAGLDVRLATTVDRLEATASGLALAAGSELVGEGSGVILTPPVPQILSLVRAGDISLPPEVAAMLAEVAYDATLAVLARLDGPSGLPDGHLSLSSGPIAWLADNQQKGISPLPALTIHSTPEFASTYLEADPAEWTPILCAAASPRLGANITAATGHRWRYAQPRTTLQDGAVGFHAGGPVVLAGEVFAGARVEGAFQSGLAAAEMMWAML